MYMPELGITLHRNNFASTRVAAVLVLLVSFAAAQATAPPQSAPNAQAPAAQTQSSAPAQPANEAPAPSSQAPAQNQAPDANQPSSQGAPQAGQPADQGQAPVGQDNGGFVFRTEAKEVVLHATVVDEKNRLITNLTKPDFTVFENDKPQQI